MKKLTNKGFVGIGLVLLALVSAGLLFVRHENAALARQYKIVRCSAKAGTKISGKQIEIERYVEKVEPKKVYFKLIVNSQKAQSLENLQRDADQVKGRQTSKRRQVHLRHDRKHQQKRRQIDDLLIGQHEEDQPDDKAAEHDREPV